MLLLLIVILMKISVVIPNRNSESFIDHCLDSLVNGQVLKPFEVIVVDDGSTDRSVEILMDTEYPIRVVFQKHKGANSARNKGLSKVSKESEAIIFCDMDCYYQPTFLKELAKTLIEVPGAHYTYCGYGEVNTIRGGHKQVMPHVFETELLRKKGFILLLILSMILEQLLLLGIIMMKLNVVIQKLL